METKGMSKKQGINDYDGLTLSTMAGGALEEMFQDELKKVLENIGDLDTECGKREIDFKITFHPGKSRNNSEIFLSAKSKLQPSIPVSTSAYLGKEGATLMAWEHDPEQYTLPAGENAITAVGGGTKRIGGME